MTLYYPKIPWQDDAAIGDCVAFEKLDGTNMHWVWNGGRFHSFGTRRDRFSMDQAGVSAFVNAHPELFRAPQEFEWVRNKISTKIRNFSYDLDILGEITVFTEFCGPRSFAGEHRQGERQEHYVIDVKVEDADGCFLSPSGFEEHFVGKVLTPRVIYKGKFTGAFCDAVRKGEYDVVEGVVCKGWSKTQHRDWRVKVKTDAYLKRLEGNGK